MAKNREETSSIDALQGVCGFVGITLGIIPLARWSIAGEHGAIFAWLFGDPSGVMGYVAPLIVVAATVLAIAALEFSKSRA